MVKYCGVANIILYVLRNSCLRNLNVASRWFYWLQKWGCSTSGKAKVWICLPFWTKDGRKGNAIHHILLYCLNKWLLKFKYNCFGLFLMQSDSRTANEAQTESSLLPCNQQSMKSNGELLQKGGRKGRSSSRYVPRQCSSSFNHRREKCSLSNGGHKGGASFPCSLRHVAEDLSSCGRR